jgi:hypothetical protein
LELRVSKFMERLTFFLCHVRVERTGPVSNQIHLLGVFDLESIQHSLPP